MQFDKATIPLIRVQPNSDLRGDRIAHYAGSTDALHIEECFRRLLINSQAIRALVRELNGIGADFMVYGGWVRDQIARRIGGSRAPKSKDIDIVVRGLALSHLRLLMRTPCRDTIFGGIACESGDFPFDIWPIQETYLIDKLGYPPTPKSLLRVTDFTINAILFSPATPRTDPALIDGGCIRSLQERTIDFKCDLLPFPTIQAARLLAYSVKLDLKFSSGVTRFLTMHLSVPANREAVREGLQKFYPQVVRRAEHLIAGLAGAR